VYIFLISQSVQPEVVGVLGAIMALQAALGVFLSLGIPTGIQLFVGESRGRGEPEKIQAKFLTNLIALSVLNAIGTVFLAVLFFADIGILEFASSDLLLVASIHFLSSVSPIFLALFIALLQSRVAAYAQILSSVMKIPIGLIALLYSQDIFSACSGIIGSYLVLDLFLVYQWKRRVGIGSRNQMRLHHFKEVVRAGRPSWIIAVFTTLGESIGVILVFNISGSLDTGLYYIAFAIASIIYLIPSSILGVLFPLLSGLDEGKENAAARAIRLGMTVTVPIAICMYIYAIIPLAILGSVYSQATPILRLLLIGALVSSIIVGYNSYVYSERKYKTVIVLGVSISLTRILTYYPFVTIAAGTGAAISYSIGVIFGVGIVAVYSKKDGLKMEWLAYAKILLPPLLMAAILIELDIHIIFGLPLLLFLSLLSYGRLNVLTKTDLRELSEVILTPNQIRKLLIFFRPVVNLIFGN
jgi:O-antigen/teichoic acid export membrane protein